MKSASGVRSQQSWGFEAAIKITPAMTSVFALKWRVSDREYDEDKPEEP